MNGVPPIREQTIDVRPFQLVAALEPSTLNEEQRTVDVVFYSGAPIRQFDWMSGQAFELTLSLKKSDVRLDRFKSGRAPFLNAHRDFSLDDQIGVIDAARLEPEAGGIATVRFAKGDPTADRIWAKIQQRIVRNVSVGARVYRFEQTDAGAGELMKRHATDWEPFEVSAVPAGADAGAHIRAAEDARMNPCVIVRLEERGDMNHPAQAGTLPLEPSTATPAPTAAAPAPAAPVPTAAAVAAAVGDPRDPGAPRGPQPPAPEAQTDRQLGVVAERRRCDSIMRAVTAVHLPVQMAMDLIANDVTLEQAQAMVIEEVSRRGADGNGPSRIPAGVSMGQDANEHVRAGITNALLHRVAPQFFQLSESGRLYRGRSVLGLAECFLQSIGQRTTHLSKSELLHLALTVRAAGLHTTSDFPSILEDVANKSLRRAYEEAPQTYATLVTRAELTDFKPVNRTQLSEAPALEAVLEHGEIPHGTMGDAKEQYRLLTWAVQFGLSRQAMINDDTNAFGRLALQFGRMARQKEADLVWAQITGNPTMGDGQQLFSSPHNNIAAVSAMISIEAISEGRAAMRQQRGLQGVEYLNIAPAYIIVPTGLETMAQQFVSQNLLAAQAENVNPFAGKLEVITDPRLDASSAIRWYLAATTAQLDMVELGFLAGQMGPAVSSQAGWDVDGVRIKVVHDVAAKVIDFRGLFTNPGSLS